MGINATVWVSVIDARGYELSNRLEMPADGFAPVPPFTAVDAVFFPSKDMKFDVHTDGVATALAIWETPESTVRSGSMPLGTYASAPPKVTRRLVSTYYRIRTDDGYVLGLFSKHVVREIVKQLAGCNPRVWRVRRYTRPKVRPAPPPRVPAPTVDELGKFGKFDGRARNGVGILWAEWYAAAGVGDVCTRPRLEACWEAFTRGVDPSSYRALTVGQAFPEESVTVAEPGDEADVEPSLGCGFARCVAAVLPDGVPPAAAAHFKALFSDEDGDDHG